MQTLDGRYACQELIDIFGTYTDFNGIGDVETNIEKVAKFDDSINGKGFVAWIKRVFYTLFKCLIPQSIHRARQGIADSNMSAKQIVMGRVLFNGENAAKEKLEGRQGPTMLALVNLHVKMKDVFSAGAYERIATSPNFEAYIDKVKGDIGLQSSSVGLPAEQQSEIAKTHFVIGVLEATLTQEGIKNTGQFVGVCNKLRLDITKFNASVFY